MTWVRDADVIARVPGRWRKLGYKGPVLANRFSRCSRRFDSRCSKYSKGERIAAPLAFEGALSDRDDPDGYVPRRARTYGQPGRSGNCFAFHYKRGGESLLFFAAGMGASPISGNARRHERASSSIDDKWLMWVRERIRGSEAHCS